MSERDAFGNPIGGASPGATLPAPDPPPPPQAPRPPRRPGRWLQALFSLVVTALLLAGVGTGGWFAYRAIRDATRDSGTFITHHTLTTKGFSSSTTSSTTSTTSPGGPAKTAPRGLATGSLLRPAAFGRTLAAARRSGGGQLRLLRLAPARADLQLARTGGLTLLQLRWDDGRTIIKTPGSMGSTKTLTYASIDRHAPLRLVTAAAHRLHRSTKTIDYVVLINPLGTPMWSAYFTGGAAFQGDAHGHVVRRIQ